ncbi:MAG: DUF433 domain-containing protein [Verrucomicrobiota bacterium]
MPTTLKYPHVEKIRGEPARLERHPRTRVAMIVSDYLWRGWSAEEIVRHYPYLTPSEVHAALTYYFDQREEIENELLEEYQNTSKWKEAHPTSPFLLRLARERHL